jgi:hypothetical protein
MNQCLTMCCLDGVTLGTQVRYLGGGWWCGVMHVRDAAVRRWLIQIVDSCSLGSFLNKHVVMLKELNAVI